MATSVWLFKPRSHGRKKEGARARNGAPLPGRLPSFTMPHRSASSALCSEERKHSGNGTFFRLCVIWHRKHEKFFLRPPQAGIYF